MYFSCCSHSVWKREVVPFFPVLKSLRGSHRLRMQCRLLSLSFKALTPRPFELASPGSPEAAPPMAQCYPQCSGKPHCPHTGLRHFHAHIFVMRSCPQRTPLTAVFRHLQHTHPPKSSLHLFFPPIVPKGPSSGQHFLLEPLLQSLSTYIIYG